MKKQIREVDEKRNIVQITTTDERWYSIPSENPITKLPEYKFVPSVTWICDSYPKGIAFYKWLADKGWDEAEALKSAAGEKGSKVHKAIEKLIAGEKVLIDQKFVNPQTGNEEELTVEEYDCILAFASWFNEVKPEIIASEITIVNESMNYAGTIDFLCVIEGKKWLVDFKTGQYIWPTYELQLSAYKKGYEMEFPNEPKIEGMAILQIGYRKNKAGWKWNEMEDKFPLFLAAQQIWANDHGTEKPKQKDYPVEVALTIEKQK